MKIILKREVKSFSKGLTFAAGVEHEAVEVEGFMFATVGQDAVRMARTNIAKIIIDKDDKMDLSTNSINISTPTEIQSSTKTLTHSTQTIMTTKAKKAAPSKAKKPAKKAAAKKATTPKAKSTPVNVDDIKDPVERLNETLRQTATKSGFDDLAKQVDAAGMKWIKRNGGQALTFKEHAISKKRGNKALLMFETKDGDVSKAVLEVASRFIAIAK